MKIFNIENSIIRSSSQVVVECNDFLAFLKTDSKIITIMSRPTWKTMRVLSTLSIDSGVQS